tara:strand:- start:5072 stop:5680 length:609 start_codon:yes stop_codon:yes gene_type:complete
MIISHKHKFIYIKCNKTAGTSTEILLETFCGKNDIVTPISKGDSNTHIPRNYKKYGFYCHVSIKDIKKKIGNEIFNSYYKFTSIRNPWDREVSGYFWKTDTHRVSFKQYLNKKIYNNYSGYYRIDGRPSIDGYIRYEYLEKDTHMILKKLNIDIGDIDYPTAKTTSRTHDKHYTEYNDDETREIIAKKYTKDIEYFGYEFGK